MIILKLKNKKIIAITDGSQGMISQVIGLSQNISNKIINLKTEILFPWSVLQPGLLPIFKWSFMNKINFENKPDIIISCGRKSVYFSLLMKKIYKKDIITIHIQNPKVDSNKFDFVVAPNHDSLYGSNVINSIGAIHRFNRKIIDDSKNIYKTKIKKKLVSIIIGGKNQHYKFSKKVVNEIIYDIIKLKKKFNNYSFLVIVSRRTDQDSITTLEKRLKNIAEVAKRKTFDSYLFALKNSDFFIVTSDSTSMISECAFTGRPVYVYQLPFKRYSKRIATFHKEFNNMNITRKFEDNLEIWKYKTLDEAKRIAGILSIRILNKYNKCI